MGNPFKPWIGVDLDGTLARYEGWEGIEHIGVPIPAMVKRVRQWIDEGKTVKIFTARASEPDPEICKKAIGFVQDWCERHTGSRLEVTCKKDFGMTDLYDDRCHTVEKNTGKILAMLIFMLGLFASTASAQVVVNGNPPNGQSGKSYSTTFTASGGTAPYTYFVTNPPDFLSMGQTTGVLSGTLQSPVIGDSYTFTVTAFDSTMAQGQANYTITVSTGGGGKSSSGGGGCVATPADVWPTTTGALIWGVGAIIWYIWMMMIFRRMDKKEKC